jgi:hypothetical protein
LRGIDQPNSASEGANSNGAAKRRSRGVALEPKNDRVASPPIVFKLIVGAASPVSARRKAPLPHHVVVVQIEWWLRHRSISNSTGQK